MKELTREVASLLNEEVHQKEYIKQQLSNGKRVHHAASGVTAYPRTGEKGVVKGYGVMDKGGRKWTYEPHEIDAAAAHAHKLTGGK